MKTLIKNGHIFTAVDSYVADILIDDGKFALSESIWRPRQIRPSMPQAST